MTCKQTNKKPWICVNIAYKEKEEITVKLSEIFSVINPRLEIKNPDDVTY